MPTNTVTKTAPERHGKCRAWLVINDLPYKLQRHGKHHWSLTPTGKLEPVAYHVTRATGEAGGLTCTCPDHRLRGTRCKHQRALVASGLMPKPRAWAGKAVANG